MRALSAICLLAIAGCTLLPAQQDRSRFFILTSQADDAPGVPAVGPSPDVSVAVGPVTLPGYLKRPEIVTRVGSDQLTLSEDQRWAEPLDSNFQRVLAQDLSQMLGTQRIVIFPWHGKTQVDYQVEVQVHRFETGSDSQSQLIAKWIIRDGRSGAELSVAETTATNAAVGDSGGATALSRDLGTLSHQIAERITELSQARMKKARSGDKSG